MVGGRVLATRGPATEPGYEIDALDAPLLEQELVFRLLGAVTQWDRKNQRGTQDRL
jgi:hypothetical protein